LIGMLGPVIGQSDASRPSFQRVIAAC
jgi:hypothetical protein